MTDRKEQLGEGNYTAGREFNRDQGDFIENNPQRIKDKAREAAEAVDGPEADDLERAEAEGRSHARTDRPSKRP